MAALDEGTHGACATGGEVVEKDIDGLPLRDHQKVDLKAILGHIPQVDDDDEDEPEPQQVSIQLESLPDSSEMDDEDMGDDDPGNNPLVLRGRRSSLRTQQHQQHSDAPDSPTGERKAVRFADALGLGLEAIRDVGDDEEPPDIPHSALSALRVRRQRRALNGKTLVLVPGFACPDSESGSAVQELLEARGVLLESCFVSSRELTVSGVVRVTNAAYEKAVTVRYSVDSWVSHRDIPANYVPNSNDGSSDKFVFIIHLPEGFGEEEGEVSGSGDRKGCLQFAVAFHAGPDTFWDNNDGENYVIDCVMRSREPSISGESKEVDCEPGITCRNSSGVGVAGAE